jgi:hypothetical protein
MRRFISCAPAAAASAAVADSAAAACSTYIHTYNAATTTTRLTAKKLFLQGTHPPNFIRDPHP